MKIQLPLPGFLDEERWNTTRLHRTETKVSYSVTCGKNGVQHDKIVDEDKGYMVSNYR